MNNLNSQVLANNTFTTPNYYQKMNQLENTILFLRDYLRDQFSITGKNCYDHCCIFFFIRFLNEERVKLLDIDSKYIFDTFLNTLEETYIQSPFDTMEVFKELLRENNVQEILDVYQFKFDIPYVKLIEILKKLKTLINPDDFNDEIDLIGKIYEMHLKTGAMGGRDVGQYFTNRRFVNYMASKMTYNTNGSGRMCDPAMGSSGFLTQFKIFNPYFNHQLVYGIEKEKSAYLGAQLNYWLTTGVKNYKFYNVDSLISREVESNYYQYILANPPFGVRGLRYNEMSADIRQLNIKSTKSDCLFVQKIYCMLEENGETLIILPNGFFNTNSNDYLLTRKLILEKCVVKAIYNLPKKINYNGNLVDAFENTGVNVRVLHFVKTFVEEDYKVPFINLNENMEEHLIEETERSELIKRDCKLVELIKTKDIRELYKGCRIVKLGDVCEINASRLNSGDMDNNGQYDFYSGKANNPCGTHSVYNFDYPEYIVLIKGGGSGKGKYGDDIGLGKCYYLIGKNAISSGCYILYNKSDVILTKYIFFYLSINKNDIMDLASYTTGLGNIPINIIKNYEIPIPSIETQKDIIKKYYDNEERIRLLKQEILNLQQSSTNNIFNRLETEILPQDILNQPINPINEIQPVESTPTIDTGSSSRSRVSGSNRRNRTSSSRPSDTQQQSGNQSINEPVPIQSTPSLDSGSSSRSGNSRSKSPQVDLEQLELTEENLKKLNKEQLIQICRNKKIRGYSGKPKDKLIELILQ